MTIDPLDFIGSAGPIRSAGSEAIGGGPAAEAVRTIGFSVVGRLLAEFGLGGGARPPATGDVYGLAAIADALAAQLPAGDSTSLGGLRRAVEAFAGAVAEDLAALADGGTLDRVERLIAELPMPAAADLGSVTDFLEHAAARLAGGR